MSTGNEIAFIFAASQSPSLTSVSGSGTSGLSGTFSSTCQQHEPGEFMNGASGGGVYYIHKGGADSGNGRYVVMTVTTANAWVLRNIAMVVNHNSGSGSGISIAINLAVEMSYTSDFAAFDTLTTNLFPGPGTVELSFSDRLIDAGKTVYVRIRSLTNIPDGSNYISYGNVVLSDVSDSFMSNSDKLLALANKFAPIIRYHPDEQFMPCNVNWYLQHSTLHKSDGSTIANPSPNDLPMGDVDESTCFLDMQDSVKPGDLSSARIALHARKSSDHTIDLQYWIMSGYNGPGTLRITSGYSTETNMSPLGEHWVDWEYIVVRVNSNTGEPIGVYLSAHSGGTYVSDLSHIQRQGDQFVVYSAKDSHSNWPSVGDNNTISLGNYYVVSWSLLNTTAEGGQVYNTQNKIDLVSCDFISSVVEPTWINYKGRWGKGSKQSMSVSSLVSVLMSVPWLVAIFIYTFGLGIPLLASAIITSIPVGMDDTNGPEGPKTKDSWKGDSDGLPKL